MARKPVHPDSQLFDYLSGALDASAVQQVEAHLGVCSDCARAVELFRALKSARQVSATGGSEHPDASEIAALFYGKSLRARAQTRAHVATCQSCAEEVAEYARAEAVASAYSHAQHTSGEVPAASWEMIREWEESSFAKPRPPVEVISQELLAKLFKLIGERPDWLRDARQTATAAAKTQIVPVIVVDRTGALRSVEMFEKVADPSGVGVLRHAARSERFDTKPVHVLHDADGRQRVVSYRIHLDTIRFEDASGDAETADYFVIEE